MSAIQLFTRHQKIARAVAAEFRLPGHSREDVRQEALLGLWEAATSWDPERGAFSTFANTVVRNHLLDCLKKARSLRQMVLSAAARDDDLLVRVAGPSDTHARAATRETLRRMARVQLTPLERQAFVCRLEGLDADETAEQLNADRKAVENAIWRVKKKMRKEC